LLLLTGRFRRIFRCERFWVIWYTSFTSFSLPALCAFPAKSLVHFLRSACALRFPLLLYCYILFVILLSYSLSYMLAVSFLYPFCPQSSFKFLWSSTFP
jgi:hypothetical protein